MNSQHDANAEKPIRRDGISAIAIVLLAAVLIGIMINYFV